LSQNFWKNEYCQLCCPERKLHPNKREPQTFSAEREYGMTLTVFFYPVYGVTPWKQATSRELKAFVLVQTGTLLETSKLKEGVDAEFYIIERAP
jgi:hypothetical protein